MTELPEPLVPGDVDLRDFDSFMLNATRMLGSKLWATSTGDEFKAWMGLLMRSWQEVPAGSLPNDEQELADLSGAGKNWPRVRKKALHGWQICSDDRLYHSVMADDVIRAALAQEKHCKNKTETKTRVQRYRERKKADSNGDCNALRNGSGNAVVTPSVRTNRQETIDSSAKAEQPRATFSDFEMLEIALSAAAVQERPGDAMLVARWQTQGATIPFVKRAIEAVAKRNLGKKSVDTLAYYDPIIREALAKPTPELRQALVESRPHDPAEDERKRQAKEAEIARAWAAGDVTQASLMQTRHEALLAHSFDQSEMNDRRDELRSEFERTGEPPPIRRPEPQKIAV